MARSLNDIVSEANAEIRKYNEAMLASKIDAMTAADKALGELEQEYAKAKAIFVYEGLKAGTAPMLDAIRRHDYGVIGHKDEKDSETGAVTRVESEKSRQINLAKFEAWAKESYAVDSKWVHILQRFNQLLCMRAAKELGLNVKVCDSYFVSEKAKEIELGATPLSNSSILKALQNVINAIVGDAYKATSHDVAYLLMTYTKKGKTALSVATSNHTTMQLLVGDILHRIVTAKGYSLQFKEAKAKDEPKPAEKVIDQAA